MYYNKVILVGNITRDIEIRYTPSGTPISNFSLAINRKYKQGEESKEEVSFFDVTAFGKQAELCKKYLGKGDGVLIEGRLQQERWEKNGEKKSKIKVIAEVVRFLPKQSKVEAEQSAEPINSSDEVPF